MARIPTPPVAASDADEWQFVVARGATPAHYVYAKPLQKSEQDDREYRVVRLLNGLQAVLVHDAKTDKAAASLDVAVGHLSDPEDMPGLAHFCEHLCFMGTEQFPKENEYSEYLAKNGGSSNAYTAASNTNYYFSVGVNALEGALTRFAGFFHSPLFSPSCTLRELNAVDSENKKNHQADMWRIFQLNKHLTKPGHAWSKFGTGNKATLTAAARALKEKHALDGERALASRSHNPNSNLLPSPIPSRVASPAPSVSSANSESEADGGMVGRETRRRLIEWWSKEYCASRMSLAIVGKESMDELTHFAASMFSPVLSRGQDPAPLIPDHPFGADEKGTIIHVKTVMDFHAFELSFPFPYLAPLWRTKPDSFIAHFVGHEGPGSLHAYLKNKGWITALSSGSQNLARGFSMFKLTVHLTKEGFKNYRSALLACYKYLSLLRSSALPERHQHEIQAIAAMRFRFAEKGRPERYATWIGEHVKDPTPRDLLLSAPKLVWEWDEDEVRTLLAQLTVNEGRVVVMAKNHESVGQAGPWEKEPWYGTEYTVAKIDEEFAKLASEPNDIPELFLPGANNFIPTNVDVAKLDGIQPLKRPLLIKRTQLSELWHKKDDQFWVPKAQVMIEARTPVANTSAQASVMTRLVADLLKDSLTEYAYDAELAGLNYEFGSHMQGLFIGVGGYNDKLDVLLQHVLDRVKSLEIKPDRLSVMKEELKQSWENFFLGQSYHLSDYYEKYVLTHGQWTITERLEVLTGISVDDLQKHVRKLMSELKFGILVNGNMRKDDAIRLLNIVETTLAPKALPEKDIPRQLSRLLPENSNHIWELQVPNPNQVNAAISYFCHVGNVASPRLRTTFRLLTQILSEPAFNVLRTKEQLGYIVSASEWSGTEYTGLRIVVQSEKDPRYLESRVEAFLVHMREILESMDEAHFEEHKNGLIRKWNEKLKNMNEESNRFWSHIDSGYLDFNRRENDAVLLQTVTKDEVLALFCKYIDPASKTRAKLSVHLRPQKTAPHKFSLPAAHAFLAALRTHNIPIDEEQYLALSASEPPIPAVKVHWADVLLRQKGLEMAVDPGVARALLDQLDVLGKQYPAEGEGEVQLADDVVFIKDVQEFLGSLRLSEPARPVEEFHDLPLSRF